jgi:hypothetical protein
MTYTASLKQKALPSYLFKREASLCLETLPFFDFEDTIHNRTVLMVAMMILWIS